MNTLRRKIRPLVIAFADRIINEAVERAQAEALEKLQSAFAKVEPPRAVEKARGPKRKPRAKAVQRDAKPTKSQRSKVDEIAKPAAKVVHRDVKPLKTRRQLERQLNEAIDVAAQSPASRPCGCGIRGPHRRECTAARPSAPATSRPAIVVASSSAADRRAAILEAARRREGASS